MSTQHRITSGPPRADDREYIYRAIYIGPYNRPYSPDPDPDPDPNPDRDWDPNPDPDPDPDPTRNWTRTPSQFCNEILKRNFMQNGGSGAPSSLTAS